MKYVKTWWVLALVLWLAPYALLFAAGSWWLYKSGWLWWWLALSGVLTLAGWPLVNWLRKKSRPTLPTVEPHWTWPPLGHAAWAKVENIAQLAQQADLRLDDAGPALRVLRDVLRAVAEHYHPRSKNPLLEIPVPHVLRVIELVSRDLRQAFSEHVPGAHILTVHDFQRLKKAADWLQKSYLFYRIGMFGVNPFNALMREFRDFFSGKMMIASADEIQRWAVGFCVRKAGFYAIQLYSGQLALEADDLRATPLSRADAENALKQAGRMQSEPLRLLVLGQVKAGKSSLVNAMFGDIRAAVDVVPRTRRVEPFVLEREGMRQALVFDTMGYAEAGQTTSPFEQLEDHVLKCDLVLVVCSATTAARRPDRELLDATRAFFQARPERAMPGVVAVLTHVDQVRPFQEWNPPYNFDKPRAPKEKNIAEARRLVAEDLGLPPSAVVPTCLEAGRVYNVEEELIPTILQTLPEAERVRYLRCLKHLYDDEYWSRLWKQTTTGGKLLWQALTG